MDERKFDFSGSLSKILVPVIITFCTRYSQITGYMIFLLPSQDVIAVLTVPFCRTATL